MNQVPLVSCYATTVHKVQGMSLDTAIVNIGDDVFTSGQSYVAISRVRSLQGLVLQGLSRKKITAFQQVHDEMLRLQTLPAH